MDGIQPQNTPSADGGSNQPLLIFQPYNMITFLSYFSPIILATIILSSSFFYQNVKGLFYLFFGHNKDSKFKIQDSRFRIQDSGFRIQDSGFRI